MGPSESFLTLNFLYSHLPRSHLHDEVGYFTLGLFHRLWDEEEDADVQDENDEDE